MCRFAHTQHEGGTSARTHHAVRFVLAEHCNGIGSAQAQGGLLHRAQQVALVQVVHEMRNHLGVGLAGEGVAAGLQFLPQLLVVLDDAVVYQGDPTDCALGRMRARRKVRVRVVHRRRAVGGPPGVRDAGARGHAVGCGLLLKFRHTGGAAGALQTAILVHGHAAGVIAAVLQALESLDQEGNDVALRNRPDDAAHAQAPTGSVKATILGIPHRHECSFNLVF